ncbi:MULE transposase, conserved domain protein, partial [mine drainage metagenome]
MIIAVGLLRFMLDYQREEIQILLESRGTRISTGEISNLSREFLLRFYCIHRRHMKDLDLDEYVLYLDGTGESGDEIVFMAKDGITRVTMDATNMPSESSDFITPFLQGVKDIFGSPLSVLRDMGNAIKESVSAVFPGILQIICHYHFVKDLGKNVFSSYPDMRASMVATKALAAISEITVPEKGDG